MKFPIMPLALALALISAAQGGMYADQVIELTPQNFDKLVTETAETWLVKFYAPWCGHCKSSAPAFSKAAKKLDGVAKLGVVNCDEHQQLAQRFGIQGFPSLKVFKGDGKKARRPSDYNQARSSKAFVDHVKYVMPSFVARVKPTGVDAFFKDLVKLPHVLLFTDKSATSPLYKGMSARFKGRVSFGEVRKGDANDLVDTYAVSSFPTLMAFKAGESAPEGSVKFQGAMDPKSLDTFFANVARGDGNYTGESEATGDDDEEKREKVFAQPKAYSGDVYSIVGTRQYEEICDARKDGRMCGLAILAGGLQHALVGELKNIAEKYQYDNLAFAVMDSSVEGGDKYAELFGVGEEGGFLVMRARKRKYALLAQQGEVTADGIKAFLDRIVGGDGRFKKLAGDLPEWKVEEKAGDDSSEDSTSEGSTSEESEEGEDEGRCGTEPPKDGGTCGAGSEEKQEM